MSDHLRRQDLRAVVPTLEPDQAFLAELSGRAAGAAHPAGGWRVALVPVAVAAILVGVAWLTGVRAGLPDPSPAPAPMGPAKPSPNTPSPGTRAADAGSSVASASSAAPTTHPGRPAAPTRDAPGTSDRPPSTPPSAPPSSTTGGATSGAGAGAGGQHAPPAGATHHPGPDGHPGQGHAYGHLRNPNPHRTHRPGPDPHAGDHPATPSRRNHDRR